MKYYPFLRVSTKQQDTDRQLADLTTYATGRGWQLEAPIAETISGGKKNIARPGIQAVLTVARRGDVVLATEISRIGRDTAQVLLFLEELADRGVSVFVLNLNLTTLRSDGTRDAMAWAMLSVGAVFGQLERAGIRERVKSGVDHARTQGRIGGRRAGDVKTDEKFLTDHADVVKALGKQLTVREVMAVTGKSSGTVQKVRKLLATPLVGL
ncbi:recombinase family protein [Hymenobacter metallilatus]|uniref:Recombinase family protein n=1 Tax=Hymenobacter metallilatus TaxID=2493666 RepID=A0A428IYM2_9BACT|nr:recombinase family protein [Hymenobacter metallilatus]RSK24202.1 recombinase family protein [Hymenobacter metallilatus]